MPQTFEDVVELLVPELHKRGLFWEEYTVPGGTYRENLNETPGQTEPLPTHPAGKLIWRPPGSSDPKVQVNGHVESSELIRDEDDSLPAWVLEGLR